MCDVSTTDNCRAKTSLGTFVAAGPPCLCTFNSDRTVGKCAWTGDSSVYTRLFEAWREALLYSPFCNREAFSWELRNRPDGAALFSTYSLNGYSSLIQCTSCYERV